MNQRKQVIRVWLDDTDDIEDRAWVVSLCLTDFGSSTTLKTFAPNDDGFNDAVSFANGAAEYLGKELVIEEDAK